jgi:hypothetical protein
MVSSTQFLFYDYVCDNEADKLGKTSEGKLVAQLQPSPPPLNPIAEVESSELVCNRAKLDGGSSSFNCAKLDGGSFEVMRGERRIEKCGNSNIDSDNQPAINVVENCGISIDFSNNQQTSDFDGAFQIATADMFARVLSGDIRDCGAGYNSCDGKFCMKQNLRGNVENTDSG